MSPTSCPFESGAGGWIEKLIECKVNALTGFYSPLTSLPRPDPEEKKYNSKIPRNTFDTRRQIQKQNLVESFLECNVNALADCNFTAKAKT